MIDRARRAVGRLTRLAGPLLLVTSCGREDAVCLLPPCALPIAITITVTSTRAPGPVAGAHVVAAARGEFPCDAGSATTCPVFGSGGTYELDISAPGFQSAHRSVVVHEQTRKCGCPTPETEHIDVALTPSA